MVRLSVVITAYNEEKKIEDCLKSVANFADEIVVVDNSSSDSTAAIAKKYTKHVYSQKNDPTKIDIQKNFGFSKATGDWILSLDADERLTEELKKEIREVISIDSRFRGNDNERGEGTKERITAYWIPRKNIIFGKWIEHTGWYPDYQLRLFQKGKGKYEAQHVHEHLVVSGETEKLTQPLLHLNYETILQFVNRHAAAYAPNEAESLLEKGYTFSYLDAIRMPFKEFINRFFAREGYKDGLHGLVLSLLMAWYHLLIFLYIWEKKQFVPATDTDFLEEIEGEMKKGYKELLYWFYNEKIKRATHTSEKYVLKIKRKMQL